MAQPKDTTERKLTSYVILAGKTHQLAALEQGRIDAANAKAAVAASADPASPHEVYVAIPASSFNVFEGTVEQPPPVFRFQEIAAKPQRAAKPKPSPETETLNLPVSEQEEIAALTAAGRHALDDA